MTKPATGETVNPFWLRTIGWTCPCGRPATIELMNARNAPIGRFCRRCGQREVSRLWREQIKASRPANRGQ